MAVDNSNRTRVKLLVSLLPGVHLRQLQRIVGLSFNSTRYHVDLLAKTGEIIRAEEGGYSRLYPTGLSEFDRTVYSLVRNVTDKKILDCLAECGTSSHKRLSDATGLAKSTISEHLIRLVEVGVVKACQTTDYSIAYELVDAGKIREMLRVNDMTVLSKAAREFVDLWDF